MTEAQLPGGMTTLPSPQRVSALLAQALELPALSPSRSWLEPLAADYARGLGDRDRPLTIALIGATGAGKSTLLNALAGQELAVEGVNRPTSRRPTVYAPVGAAAERLEAIGAEVVRYPMNAGGPWAGQIFIDTPDLNSVELGHQELARRALELADVAMVVMHRGSVVEAVQADFLLPFARRRRLVFVLNFADQLSESSQAELRRQVSRLAEQQLHLAPDDVQVFAVSALQSKQLRTAGPGFLALVDSLRSLAARAVAEQVRSSNATGVLAELRSRVSAGLAQTESAISEVEAALEGGFKRARSTMEEDFALRLESARSHLSSEVRRQAASRWWGPAAWSMRLSLAGAGGLGAASLVSRANLPLGLAVAAASTALSRIQEKTRSVAAQERVLTGARADEDPTLTHAARAALAEARTAAHRLGLAPEQLGLSDPDELLVNLAEVRAAAWQQTEQRGVTEAIIAWWRWARLLLLPLVNLPLLALLGHVGYRVAKAYVYGPYLGVDYFLNASALAVALTGAGALLGSLSLAGVARKARREGQRRFTQGLDALFAAQQQRCREAMGPARAAARQLSSIP